MPVAECKIIRQKASVGVSTYLGLSDTPGSFTANRIIHANPAGTALVDSNVNILSTGAFLVGRTTAFSGSSVAEFGKNQNTLTAVQVINETNGVAANAAFFAEQGSGGNLVTGSFKAISTSFTPTLGREADSVDVASVGAASGLVLRTEDDAPIKLKPNQTVNIEMTDTTLGFFGTTPAARPTGVAVTAAGIHAALVTLGLITA